MGQSPYDPSSFSAPSDAVEAILESAIRSADDGDWEVMIGLLSDGLEAHPEDPYLLCWLGLAEMEIGEDGAAYDRFKRVLATNPPDPVLLATAGNAVAAFDDPDAEGALRSAVLLAPDLPQARWMYGAYLSREGMTKEAMEQLDVAIELDPDDPLIQTERGVAQALGGDLPGAAFSFGRAAELDPEDGWALLLLGLARVEAGEVEESLGALEEGARLRPEDFDAQLIAALALFGCGWEDRGWEMLERARLHADRQDAESIEEVESRLSEGPDEALQWLTDVLAPSSFRERLLQRP
jgi:tetratricopeptide (TPR) repeat protein